MVKMDYKLRAELFGHSLDVRSVAASSDMIITGSRDKTAKIYKVRQSDNEIELLNTLTLHDKFVSCVYYWENGGKGYIVTASHDKLIYIFDENEFNMPAISVTGHSGPIVALAKGHANDFLISGSWDNTARIWHVNFQEKTVESVELKGHEQAVWAVVSSPKRLEYVTGSADKMIYFWNIQGQRTKTLKGHTDCVRGLVMLGDALVSVSNDTTIRVWEQNGECVKELHGHAAYIYSIAVLPCKDNNLVVTCGEDSSIRIWNVHTGEEMCDPLILPAQSVWSVACTPKGDIISGSSDGLSRVFTTNKALQVSDEQLMAYNDQVQMRLAQLSQSIGNIKKTDLPGPEALQTTGREGQTKMIRQTNGKVEIFKWDNGSWVLLGEVTGAPPENREKVTYNGKEYDYVFTVDAETETPLKLPYNLDEDPWIVAQRFIHEHKLPQDYLDNVAKFIIKNSNQSQSTFKAPSGDNTFFDPFTGESRYTPGNAQDNLPSVGNADPFTGSSSYSSTMKEGKLLPSTELVVLKACNNKKILEKLNEFNKRAGAEAVDQSQLDKFDILTANLPSSDNFKTIRDMLQWSPDILFPVLDVVRLVMHKEEQYNLLKQSISLGDLLSKFAKHINSNAANKLMIIRCLSNMLNHGTGMTDFVEKFDFITEMIGMIARGNTSTMEQAYSALYLNLSITFLKLNSFNGTKILKGTLDCLECITDECAQLRCLSVLVNLLSCSDKDYYSSIMSTTPNLFNVLKTISARAKDLNLKNFAVDLLKTLNSQ